MKVSILERHNLFINNRYLIRPVENINLLNLKYAHAYRYNVTCVQVGMTYQLTTSSRLREGFFFQLVLGESDNMVIICYNAWTS